MKSTVVCAPRLPTRQQGISLLSASSATNVYWSPTRMDRSRHETTGRAYRVPALALGVTTDDRCPVCGWSYVRGDPDEEAFHREAHAPYAEAIDWLPPLPCENIVHREGARRIVLVAPTG